MGFALTEINYHRRRKYERRRVLSISLSVREKERCFRTFDGLFLDVGCVMKRLCCTSRICTPSEHTMYLSKREYLFARITPNY